MVMGTGGTEFCQEGYLEMDAVFLGEGYKQPTGIPQRGSQGMYAPISFSFLTLICDWVLLGQTQPEAKEQSLCVSNTVQKQSGGWVGCRVIWRGKWMLVSSTPLMGPV